MTHTRHSLTAAIVAAGAMAGLSFAPASAQKIGESLDEVIALAKKEGTVQLSNTWRKRMVKVVVKGFEDTYGLKVKQTRARGMAARERILSEAVAGLVEFDIVNVSGELRPQFVKAGVIHKIPWKKYFPKVRPMLIDPAGYYIAAGISRYGIVFNNKLVPAKDVPKTWEDCLDPKFKGNMAVYTRPRTWTGLWPGWGEEKSLAFHRRLKDAGPIWTTDQTNTGTRIAAGEYRIGCGLGYHTFLNVKSRDKLAPIGFVLPTELPLQIGEGFAIMKGAKSPNGAILLAGYLASPEGQKLYKVYGRSNPFVDGTVAAEQIAKSGSKTIFGGWDFAGAKEAAAAKKIVEAWGFPKGK